MQPLKRHPAVSISVLALALAAHVAFWWLLRAPSAPRPSPAAAMRISVLLPPLLPSPPLPRAPPPPVPDQAAARPSPAKPTPRAQTRPVDASPPAAPPLTPPPAVAAAADPPPAGPAASAPVLDLLDTPASRRAIREAARQSTLAERSAQVSDEPARLRPDQRLGNAIAAGAKGDCDKGEYVGGGMGLLSLPFWALAKLREDCSK